MKLFYINTFSFIIKSKYIKIIKSIKELKKIIIKYNIKNNLKIIIGDCSNTIFLEDFQGFILLNRIFGIKKYSYKNKWILHVNSGEKWSNLVKYSLKNKIYGLENLYNIPGRVGSAAVNNIGSYGIEFKDICQHVYVLDIYNLKIFKLNNYECDFNYRNSIFKKKFFNRYIILSIIIKLNKKWRPNLSHLIFNNLDINTTMPNIIKNIIIKNRIKNIPNYNIIGNSGSFFKNFIVNKKYINKYKNLNSYKFNLNYYKIGVNYIINNIINNNLKIGDITMFDKNKIILINLNIFYSNDLIKIIRILKKIIKKNFNLKLINEVLLIKNILIKKNIW